MALKVNSYKNKKILITGHTGFKGSWLSIWLKNLGANVIGYALDPPNKPNLFDSIQLKDQIVHNSGDIRNGKKLISIVKKVKPDFVFHLAAQPLVRYSYNNPKYTYDVNVIGTVNILEAIRHSDFKGPCVVVTTDKCYENKEWVYGYREVDVLGGYDPYSSSKACAELVVNAYRQSFFNPKEFNESHDVSLSSVRAGNVIGGGDWGEDRLIPDCITALSKHEKIIIRNPLSIRPWQYILDPISGYLILGDRMYDDGQKFSGAWNFGPNDENNISVEQLVKLVIRFWGTGEYEGCDQINPHEAQLLKLDISKAKTLLGWKPQYTVEEAIKRTITWYKAYYNGSNPNDLQKICIDEIINH